MGQSQSLTQFSDAPFCVDDYYSYRCTASHHTFSHNHLVLPSSLAHTIASVNEAGTYPVIFHVSCGEHSCFAAWMRDTWTHGSVGLPFNPSTQHWPLHERVTLRLLFSASLPSSSSSSSSSSVNSVKMLYQPPTTRVVYVEPVDQASQSAVESLQIPLQEMNVHEQCILFYPESCFCIRIGRQNVSLKTLRCTAVDPMEDEKNTELYLLGRDAEFIVSLPFRAPPAPTSPSSSLSRVESRVAFALLLCTDSDVPVLHVPGWTFPSAYVLCGDTVLLLPVCSNPLPQMSFAVACGDMQVAGLPGQLMKHYGWHTYDRVVICTHLPSPRSERLFRDTVFDVMPASSSSSPQSTVQPRLAVEFTSSRYASSTYLDECFLQYVKSSVPRVPYRTCRRCKQDHEAVVLPLPVVIRGFLRVSVSETSSSPCKHLVLCHACWSTLDASALATSSLDIHYAVQHPSWNDLSIPDALPLPDVPLDAPHAKLVSAATAWAQSTLQRMLSTRSVSHGTLQHHGEPAKFVIQCPRSAQRHALVSHIASAIRAMYCDCSVPFVAPGSRTVVDSRLVILQDVDSESAPHVVFDDTCVGVICVLHAAEEFDVSLASETMAEDDKSKSRSRASSTASADFSATSVISVVHQELLKTLSFSMVAPLRLPRLFSHFFPRGFPAPGILLYGPSGCGKTHIAHLLARILHEDGGSCIFVRGPEVFSKFIGQTEANVRAVFTSARSSPRKPVLIVLDEIDALAPRRGRDSAGIADRVVNTLLTELDGVESRNGIAVLATTSRPEVIDPAVVRSGRLDQHLFVGGITTSEGLALMGHALREKGWDIVEDAGDTAFHQLLQKYPHSQRYSVADWLAVTATAQQHALQIDRTSRTITSMGLQCALESTQPSISDAEWLRWDRLQAESAHRRNNNNSTTAAGSKSSHRPQKVTLA